MAAFFDRAGADHRIGPVHVSLYFALLNGAARSGMDFLLPVRPVLMREAKIASVVTYHRSLKQLHTYGYIEYRPSFVAGRSRVRLI